MAAVQTRSERALNRLAIAAVLVITLLFLAPIYWITSTAFKPRNLATTIPPDGYLRAGDLAFCQALHQALSVAVST